MLTDISHEIKTPVSVIRAGSETLNSGALNDIGTAKKFTKSIQENAERLSEMIDDLLELEKIIPICIVSSVSYINFIIF